MDRPADIEPEPPGARERLAVGALYLLAVVVYALLGHRMPVPMVSPDEYTYGHLAQSIAHGDGLSWRGADQPLRAALYVLVIAPAWLGDSTVTGYAIAKILGAALVCSVVFPVWWLMRRVTEPRLALLTAALVVSGTALVIAGEILTENLAYPLATWSLAATVLALREPARRWWLLALGLALAAAAARAQLAALVPVILLAVLADAARRGPGRRRAALAAQRRLLIAAGALAGLGLLAVLVARSTALGSYAGLGSGSPSQTLAAVGHQLVGLVTSAGIIPAIVVLAVSARAAAWRDAWIGPLLAVLWAATAVFVVESAIAIAGFDTAWHIERYVMYVLPLAFIVTVAGVARGLAGLRHIAVAAAAVGAALLFAPGVREAEEELATYAIFRIGDAALGLSAQAGMLLATAVAALVTAAVLAARGLRDAPARAAALAGALVAGLAILAVPAWTWKTDVARGWRAVFPANLQWSDDSAGPPLARLIGAANASVFEVGEFFNRDIGQTFVPETPIGGREVRGRTCAWRAGADGTLEFDTGCGDLPRRFYLDDYYAKFTFHDQRVEQDRPPVARITSVPPPARPRLRAEFFPPCAPPLPTFAVDGRGPTVRPPRPSCQAAAIGGRFWLDRPATLVLRWRGGIADVQAAVGGRTYTIPARRITAIRLPIGAPAAAFGMQLGWRGSPPQAPRLLSARLVDAAGSTELLY